MTRRDDLEAARDAVLDAIDARIDTWGDDEDLSDWVKPTKIVRADLVNIFDALIAQEDAAQKDAEE
jgi:hypothetical protein